MIHNEANVRAAAAEPRHFNLLRAIAQRGRVWRRNAIPMPKDDRF